MCYSRCACGGVRCVAVPVGSYPLRYLLFRCIMGQGLVRLVAIRDPIIVPLTPAGP